MTTIGRAIASTADVDRFRYAFIHTCRCWTTRRIACSIRWRRIATGARRTCRQVFAPDGIERFDDAWARRVDVEGFPVCHPDDIIASRVAANLVREFLPRLRAFRDYWIARQRDRRSQQ